MRVQIQSAPIRDIDNKYASVSVPAGSGNNTSVVIKKILSFQTRFGCRGYIRSIANAVQSGGETFVTFRLLINGAWQAPYDAVQDQLSDPANPIDLPERIPVPQGSLVEIQVDNSDVAAWIATARVIVDYEDF